MLNDTIHRLSAAQLLQVSGGFTGSSLPGLWPPVPPSPRQPSFPPPFPIPSPPRPFPGPQPFPPMPTPIWPGQNLRLI